MDEFGSVAQRKKEKVHVETDFTALEMKRRLNVLAVFLFVLQKYGKQVSNKIEKAYPDLEVSSTTRREQPNLRERERGGV